MPRSTRSACWPYLYGELWRASIAAQLGDRDEAVDLLREALAQGQSYDRLHGNATLEPRGYPPYEELVSPRD